MSMKLIDLIEKTQSKLSSPVFQKILSIKVPFANLIPWCKSQLPARSATTLKDPALIINTMSTEFGFECVRQATNDLHVHIENLHVAVREVDLIKSNLMEKDVQMHTQSKCAFL